MAYTTIDNPALFFNTVTYTGNASGQTITGVGHQPDFIWVKQRGDAGYDHSLHNSVSGVLKQLISNKTDAEITNTDTVTSTNADGFVLGADTAGPNANSNNQDTKTYVAWNWKAGGSASSNSNGSITSSVSANTTAGFSIVSWTGSGANATVGHGLGVVPKFMIFKSIASSNWGVYHVSLGNTDAVFLNETTATGSSSNYWNNTSPTSSVFSLGNGGTNGGSTNNTGGMIAYCFAEKKGYSKFGSHTGNGNADGTFIYTGFKPAFLLSKRTDSSTGGSWILYDNKRGNNIFNPTDVVMAASNNQSESDWGTNYDCDFLSNGIKWRYNGAAGYGNTSGASYIYMAFAESPFVTAGTKAAGTAR